MILEARMELRLTWRTWVLPAALIICALLAIANVANAAGAVRADYRQLVHTRAQYAANHMDFLGDLHRPADVSTKGDDQSIGNLARYDYDTLTSSIAEISPSRSVAETLKYLGFLIYPALFFLVGLWMSTSQRRYRFEKVTLVRSGSIRTVAARQLALLAVAAIVIVVTIAADFISRSIAQSELFAQLPLTIFTPLSPQPPENVAAQWLVILLVTAFFGGAGIAIGTAFGVFAVPAIVFIIGDYIVPIFAQNDPRNWFEVLGHSAFTYSGSFDLAEPIPLAVPLAFTASAVSAAVLIAAGYVGMALRNPRAT